MEFSRPGPDEEIRSHTVPCKKDNCWSSGSHHTQPPHYQNGCSPKNFCSNHACCLMDIAAFKYSIQYVPQTTATIFAFSSSLSFFYDMYCTLYTLHSRCTVSVQLTRHSAVSNRTRQASFFLRQRDISTASMRHFYCVNATFPLRQRDISTASSRHFYCVNATFLCFPFFWLREL